jgi:ribosomal protein L7Ae-like RNA K-turn-binding protein
MADAAVISAETKRILLERLSAEITSKKTVAVRRRRRRLRHDDNATKDKKNMGGRKRKRVVDESTGQGSIENEDDWTTGTANATNIVGNVKSSVIKSRFVLGINECTRTLEGTYKILLRQEQHDQQCTPQLPETETKSTTTAAHIVPSLILLARDVRPTDVISHFYMYAKLLNIPLLILPGVRASEELGKAAGIRSVAVALFLPMPNLTDNGIIASDVDNEENRREEKREWRNAHADVDSFVRYAITKIPK